MIRIEASLMEIENVLKEIKKINPKIIFLKGDLGSGKTTLVKAFAKSLGIEGVTSPTFSKEQIYEDRIFHYDFYQTSFEEIISLGIAEEFEKKGIHFIEWGDEKLQNFLKNIGFKITVIEIKAFKDKREYRIYYA